jgi:hypothetical protein
MALRNSAMRACRARPSGGHGALYLNSSKGGDHIGFALPVARQQGRKAANYKPTRASSPRPVNGACCTKRLCQEEARLRQAGRSWARYPMARLGASTCAMASSFRSSWCNVCFPMMGAIVFQTSRQRARAFERGLRSPIGCLFKKAAISGNIASLKKAGFALRKRRQPLVVHGGLIELTPVEPRGRHTPAPCECAVHGQRHRP